MPERRNLQALTALRFFAALAIVFHHLQGNFGLAAEFARPFILAQGVSFFFVLSGFILTHAHGQLEANKAPRFWWARFARVWPGHAAAIVLVVCVSGWHSLAFAPALANLTLVHAWFPWPSYYFSLNNVSWTLCVEAFFYALFPLVTRKIDRRWPFWLALSLAFGFGMAQLGHLYGGASDEPDSITVGAFVYFNPLGRWFEFVLGICAAVAWKGVEPRVVLGRVAGTALEAFALGCAGLAAYHSASLSSAVSAHTAQFLWLANGPIAAPAFALLIAVMACERGAISRALSHPFPVRLGEISYALYLIHFPLLLLAFAKYPAASSGLGIVLLLAQFLLASHLLWQCVESPARRALTRLFPMSEGRASGPLFPANERATLAFTVIAHTAVLLALFAIQKAIETQ